LSATNAAKKACKNGHVFTPENTYTSTSRGSPMRQCRQCRRERSRTAQRRHRSAVLDAKAFARLVDAIRDGVPESDLAGRFNINHETFLIAARAAKAAA